MLLTRFVGALGLALFGTAFLPGQGETPPRREPVAILKQLGSDTLRHGAPVRALVWSGDGKWLYSAAQDGTIARWNMATGKEQIRFVGPVGTVRALILSPDGKTLIAGGSDRVVRLFDAQAPGKGDSAVEVVARNHFTLGGDAIESLAFHASGETFFVGTEQGRWLVIETATTKELEARTVGEPVRCLAYVADKKLLLANHEKGGFAVWQAANFRKQHETEGETLRCLAVDVGGTVVAAGDFQGELSVLKLPAGPVLWKKKVLTGPARRAEVSAVAFAPDGKTLVSAGSDGELRHWNVATGEEVGKFEGHRGTVHALAFRPDGKELVSAGDDGLIQRWDPATHQPIGPGPAVSQRVRSLSLSKEGKEVALVFGGRLDLRDGRTLEALKLPVGLERPHGVRAAVLLPDGKEVLVQLADGSVHRARLADGGDLLPVLSASARAAHLAVEGTTLAALTEDRQLLLVDLTGKRETLSLSLQGDIGKAVAFSPGGKYVGVVASSSIIRIFETTGKPVHELEGPLGGGLGVAFSPDARLAYTAGRDRMVRVTEVATGLSRQELPIGPGYPTSLTLTPDGRFLAVGTNTGSVLLIDTTRGLVLDQLEGHRGPVTTVAFTPDGTNALFSVASDGVLYLRDVAPVLKANKPQPLTLTKQQLEVAWAQLGLEDPRNVAVAVQTLVRAEKDVLPLLKDRIHPIEGARVMQLFKDLDAEDFEVRDKAMRELSRMGRSIEGALKAMREKPGTSVEVRVRVEELLDQIAQGKVSREYLQSLRGIEVLERVGGSEATAILEKVAAGLGEAELTRQAKAALERLKMR
jgi:WD40 repeat protein